MNLLNNRDLMCLIFSGLSLVHVTLEIELHLFILFHSNSRIHIFLVIAIHACPWWLTHYARYELRSCNPYFVPISSVAILYSLGMSLIQNRFLYIFLNENILNSNFNLNLFGHEAAVSVLVLVMKEPFYKYLLNITEWTL